MKTSESYMENQTIVLPNIVDGPTAIGDLWDCQNSKSIGLNLFGKKLSSDHLQANVMKELKYTLTHLKNTKDRQKSLQVSGEVALELMGGLIKVSGGAEYDSDQQTFTSEEELLCHYDLKTYSVKALPSAKEIMDPLVMEKILKGDIKATHVVVTTVLGAEVMASIRITESKSDTKEDIKGNFFGKLIVGPISASVKVALGVLDTSKEADFEKKIKVNSRPAMPSQPATVSEMFQVIESIHKVVEAENHPAFNKSNESKVYGVPLRYYLVPIKHFLDIPVEKLYLQIKEDVLEKMTDTLATLRDYQIPGILKKKILEKDSRLKRILLDENNPLVIKIFNREKEIYSLAKKYYSEIAETLKGYKVGKLDQESLLNLANKIDDELNITSILYEIQGFISEGRKELYGIRDGDITDTHQLKIFTNSMDMLEWYQTQKPIKVLLRTGENSVTNGRVTCLYDISGLLRNIGVDVGVAFPNISDGRHDLSIKINDLEVTYCEEEITFVIQILLLLVNKADQTSTRLYSIYASLNGVKLPLQSHMVDLHSIINIMREVKQVIVADSYLKTRDYVLQNDGRLKFLMDLDAFDSAADSVSKFKHLSILLPQEAGDWIVGKYGFESPTRFTNSPLLFIFKDERLLASCLDNLDIILLSKAIKLGPDGVDLLRLLSAEPASLEKSCVHRARGDFAVKVNQMFQCNQSISLENEHKLSSIKGFASHIDPKVQAIRIIIRSFLNNDRLNLWGAMASLLLIELPDVETILKAHNWIPGKNGYTSGFKSVGPQELSASLKEYFSTQDPFYAKVELARSILSCSDPIEQKKEAIEGCIVNLANDPECPNQLKEQLSSYQEFPDLTKRFECIEKTLINHLEKVKGKKFETVALFIQLLEIPMENFENFVDTQLICKLLTRLKIDEDLHTTVLNLADTHEYYKVLHILAQVEYVQCQLSLVCNQLEALTSLTDTKGLSQCITKLAKHNMSELQYQWLFNNPKFVYLLELNSSCVDLLQNIKIYHCQKSIPTYIPECLRDGIKKMIEEDSMVDCPDIIDNVDQAVTFFQRIASHSLVPDNFSKVLSESLRKNLDLKTAFEKADALFFWSEEHQLFTEKWDCQTIKKAYEKLIEWTEAMEHKRCDNSEKVEFNIPINERNDKFQEDHSDDENMDNGDYLDGAENNQLSWMTLIRSFPTAIGPREFLEIQSILTEPHMEIVSEEDCMAKLLPYIIQHLKMWGTYVIEQENLAKLSNSKISIPIKGRSSKKPVFNKDGSQSQPLNKLGVPIPLTKYNYPIAKLDILSCLNAVCHRIVFQDLLRVLSHFPGALPLILPNLTTSQSEYVCLVPLFNNASVKWEVQPGVVIHNQLFTNPFKMTVALRVGSARSGSSGKSTILNQVMGVKYMFSSFGGPGSNKGTPLTLNGSVEFTVLLQESCSAALWEFVIKSHCASGSKEVLMLANVHGDALHLRETVEWLKQIATSFIIFFMPCTNEELQVRSAKIHEMLGDTDDIVYALVDPSEDCQTHEMYQINTSQLTMADTLETVRALLGEAVRIGSPLPSITLSNMSNTIKLSPKIFTKESEALITYIRQLGCRKVKSILQLQKINPRFCANFSSIVSVIWKKDPSLQNLISKFTDILNLPIQSRLLAFTHLDRELSVLTSNESIQIREKLNKFQEQRRRTLNFDGGSSSLSAEQNRLIEQIRLTMDELDDISLGMEHLYRELGRIYQAAQCNYNTADNGVIFSLARRYAELLISGQAVEILDGDLGEMCGPWFSSICHSVCERYPDLRVFTLSIIGLQSSGKSTLLNALFACKFAVSVGRCTRGLFMRLIFLDKTLTDELQFDAILLIDTEGLGAPEKLNDPDAEHKDRLLATFAMSVSNLTLINVLGESLRDLTDILQIVIVTMARLEKADISPDILMVQHLSERDSSKTMKGEDEFCKALEEAVALTDSQDTAIGVRNCKSLRKLQSRVKNGELRKLFRPYKDGASANAPPSREYHEDVVDLYKTILHSCKQMTGFQKFHTWHELIQNYWSAVSSQDFTLRFKNIQEVHEFIDRGSTIAKVKQSIDGAFRDHRESCETTLRRKVNELASNPTGIANWDVEKEAELGKMREVLKWIPHSCETNCTKCSEAVHSKNILFQDLEGKSCQLETEGTINLYIQKTRDSVLKHLNQMAEAIRVKHGWSCEFDATIGSILMDKLRIKPNPSEAERKNMVDEVWSQLQREISHQLQVEPAERRICNEVAESYRYVPEILGRVNRGTKNAKLPELRDIEAIDFSWGKKVKNAVKSIVGYGEEKTLDYNQVTFLISMLDEIPNTMLRDYKTDHFEHGMVITLKEKIESTLEQFKEKHIRKGNLIPMFKWEVHVYAILKFIQIMSAKEAEWDKHNNPYKILIQNEDTYKKKIYIRLKHGFGFEAEGRIIGEVLLKAIRKRGQNQGDRAHIDNVRSVSWLTSSENVRLNYFSKLAQLVDKGDKQQALEHFRNPSTVIKKWFKKEVNSVSQEIGKQKFTETVDSELVRVIQDIRNQKNCKGIQTFVSGYLIHVEDIEYNPGVDMDSDNLTDFDILQKVILKTLDENQGNLKFGILLTNASDHLEITSLLGCTEHCFWCGSLCWGQSGHQDNMDSTKKHHSCHQPQGLIGVGHKTEKYLISHSCDHIGDDWTNYWHNCSEGMAWAQTKLHADFVNWIFTSHNKTEFNDLMKWFYLKLHNDISNNIGKLPALDNELSAMGFHQLVALDHILATIKSRI